MKLRQPKNKSQPKEKKRQILYPNIVINARLLGVNRSHLWRVLTGERKSPGLLRRFKILSQQTPQPPATTCAKNL
jgi:hypothetical protein